MRTFPSLHADAICSPRWLGAKAMAETPLEKSVSFLASTNWILSGPCCPRPPTSFSFQMMTVRSSEQEARTCPNSGCAQSTFQIAARWPAHAVQADQRGVSGGKRREQRRRGPTSARGSGVHTRRRAGEGCVCGRRAGGRERMDLAGRDGQERHQTTGRSDASCRRRPFQTP